MCRISVQFNFKLWFDSCSVAVEVWNLITRGTSCRPDGTQRSARLKKTVLFVITEVNILRLTRKRQRKMLRPLIPNIKYRYSTQSFVQTLKILLGRMIYYIPKLELLGELIATSSSYISTDGQSASSSWCRALFGAADQISIFFVWQLLSYSCRAPSLTRGLVCNLHCKHSLVRVAQDT
jgi:hypothetical protein